MRVCTLFRLSLLMGCTFGFPALGRAECINTPGVPCAERVWLPCGINLVGHNGGTLADPLGEFTVTLADWGNNPIPGADVWLDFSACCDDIRLASVQYGPGLFLGPGKTVHCMTDAHGVARFRIMGAATASSSTPGLGCAEVWARNEGVSVLLTDGVSRPKPTVGAFDLDGALPGGAGVGPSDLSLWEADFFSSLNPFRSDYDFSVLCVRSVGPSDLAKWLQVFFGGGSVGNGAAFVACP